jgi:predicted nucleic acid-binding protein
LETSPTIQTRDAFLAAVMLNHGLREIISTDSHFDRIPAIRRVDPGKK